ncbi:uroporphyrinogen-III synthase [Buchnera aphidicola]|uniref:uroporphyrinogen-III synthase n=1 Tax=Buchnera aphidicola TaxID=9 RepID=UPI002905EA40|nr:uroporphyrinogen-III synthase [Buchnera aphidicola]
MSVFYFTVGKTSAKLLKKVTKIPIQYPWNIENSENLIKIIKNNKKINKKNVVIINGNIGRIFLKKELKKDGYKVFNLECYRRKLIQYNKYTESIKWKKNKINTLIITSCEILKRLEYLFHDNKNKKWIYNCTIICTGERIKKLALNMGWKKVILCSSANNYVIFQKIKSLKWSAKEDLNL